jgi:hypothetical protein
MCQGIGGDCGCFLAGTSIRLADGSTKPIELLQQGDRVTSYDLASRQSVLDEVSRIHKPRTVDHHLVINGKIHTTDTQPFLVDGRWVTADRLRPGHRLTSPNGSSVPITSIEHATGEVVVYNLEILGHGTYVADDVIVHNKDLCYTIDPRGK